MADRPVERIEVGAVAAGWIATVVPEPALVLVEALTLIADLAAGLAVGRDVVDFVSAWADGCDDAAEDVSGDADAGAAIAVPIAVPAPRTITIPAIRLASATVVTIANPRPRCRPEVYRRVRAPRGTMQPASDLRREVQ
ncbi:hypothetical protein ACXDF8_01330 [Mycolicibacterium sp. CBM1]